MLGGSVWRRTEFPPNRGVRDDRSQDTAKTLLDGLRQP